MSRVGAIALGILAGGLVVGYALAEDDHDGAVGGNRRSKSRRVQQYAAIYSGDTGLFPDAPDSNDAGVWPDADPPDSGDAGIWPDADVGGTDQADAFSNQVSAHWDGGATYATSADDENLECDTEAKMTVCTWLRLGNQTSAKPIASKWNTSNQSWKMDTNTCSAGSCGLKGYIATTLADNTTGGGKSAILTNLWGLACMVFDGTQASNATRLQIYWNNVQQTLTFSGTIPSNILNGTAALQWGKAQSVASYFGNGDMDELAIWCDALSTTQLSAVWNSGSGAANLATAFGGSPPAQWRVWLRVDGNTNPTLTNQATGCSGACPSFTWTGGQTADFTTVVPP